MAAGLKLLLDTHVFVWASTRSHTLPATVVEAIDGAHVVFVSPVSVYEIDYKRARDAELAKMPEDLEFAVSQQGFVWLPITAAHMRRAARLPRLHKDPWDRLLVGQSVEEGLTLLTRDAQLADYAVETLW